MHIKIAQHLKPFSHCPGTYLLLPGSTCRLQVFPTHLKIADLSGPIPKLLIAIDFNILGPVNQFTVIQNLEQGIVCVFGHADSGYFRYTIKPLSNSSGVVLHIEKSKKSLVISVVEGGWKCVGSSVANQGESFRFGSSSSVPEAQGLSVARLSLGNHQSQDWELLWRRNDLSAIFPLWHALGQLIPGDYHAAVPVGTIALLDHCRKAISAHAPEFICPAFHRLLLAGFEGALSPRLVDTDYHGLDLSKVDANSDASPLQLLQEGSLLIRSLFVSHDSQCIHLLPALPPEFHCGRFLNVHCGELGVVDFEWTKKQLRSFVFRSKTSKKVNFKFSKNEKSCRLRTSNAERGHRYLPGTELEITPGQIFLFDNFER